MAVTGEVLTEAQVVALEREQDDDDAHGEIETAHLGYLRSRYTFYVGTLKGLGRDFQQNFVDTYSERVVANLYPPEAPSYEARLGLITTSFLLQSMILSTQRRESCTRRRTEFMSGSTK